MLLKILNINKDETILRVWLVLKVFWQLTEINKLYKLLAVSRYICLHTRFLYERMYFKWKNNSNLCNSGVAYMFYCSILRWLFCPTIFRRKLIKPKMKIKCQHCSHSTLVLVFIHPKSVKEEALKTRLFYDNRSKWGGGKLETKFFRWRNFDIRV